MQRPSADDPCPGDSAERREMLKAAAWRMSKIVHCLPAEIMKAEDPIKLIKVADPRARGVGEEDSKVEAEGVGDWMNDGTVTCRRFSIAATAGRSAANPVLSYRPQGLDWRAYRRQFFLLCALSCCFSLPMAFPIMGGFGHGRVLTPMAADGSRWITSEFQGIVLKKRLHGSMALFVRWMSEDMAGSITFGPP